MTDRTRVPTNTDGPQEGNVQTEASTTKHRYDGQVRGRDDGLHTCICGGVWSDFGCDLDEASDG